MAERRSPSPSQSLRARESVRFSNPDVFSDYFVLAPLEVTGAHRAVSPEFEANHDATSDIPRRSFSLQQALESPAGSIRRNRGSQRSDGQNSMSSRFEDRASRFSNQPRSGTSVSESGNIASPQHRSIRAISTFGFPRAQSPYQGATGPSQPYGMYSQDIGPIRTPSTATTSTIRRPERSYSGPSEPTQPYGMYPQNTVPEDETEFAAGLTSPNVAGYSGSRQNYQRRLGSNGEDVDDLIGSDGYTEQLPPYSRYANGVPPKYTSDAGSIGRRSAPPAPLNESQETLNSPQLSGMGPVNPFGDSSTQLSSNNSVAIPPKDEGFQEKVKRRSKKKVCCGISLWLSIAIVVVVFLAILLGGVIGGVVAHKRGEEKGMKEALAAQTVTAPVAAPTATVTQMSPPPDAVSLSSTPTSLPPLQAGTYSVTLDQPNSLTNSCLTDTAQLAAWDCATSAELSLVITTNGPLVPLVSLSYPESPDPSIRYGAQPPELSGQASLMLMRDRDAFYRGPAYIFAQQYNKTVIVHNSDLPGGQPGSKRSFIKRWFFNNDDAEDTANLHQRDNTYDSQWESDSIAQPADRPWYCYWPGTILEGFIFVTQDADQSASETANGYSAATTNEAFPIPTPSRGKRQAGDLSAYPKTIKIEERRDPSNPIKPYCQQMQILYNHLPNPLRDPETGQLVQIQLDESEPDITQHQVSQQGFNQWAPGSQPSAPAFATGSTSRRRSVERRGSTDNTPMCRCEWISGR